MAIEVNRRYLEQRASIVSDESDAIGRTHLTTKIGPRNTRKDAKMETDHLIFSNISCVSWAVMPWLAFPGNTLQSFV